MSEQIAAADWVINCRKCNGAHKAGECLRAGDQAEQILWSEIRGELRKMGYISAATLALFSHMKQVFRERTDPAQGGELA